MKKIKALAILMAMTLTFSMFATAASAADVTLLTQTEGGDLTSFTLANFNKNLTNAKYAALFTFDNETEYNSESKNRWYKFDVPVVGASENVEVTATFKMESDTSTYKMYYLDTADDTALDSTLNPNFASNKDCIYFNAKSKISVNFTEVNNLKPVAIGYFVTAHKSNAYTTAISNNVTVNLSEGDAYTGDKWTGKASNGNLFFYGYKAPVGKYIDSVEIFNEEGGTNMRIDDFCIIYEEVSKIETGVRFSTDKNGYVEFNDMDQFPNSASACVNVSSTYEGKLIVLAGYNADNMLVFTRTPDTDPASQTYNPLYVSKGINENLRPHIKTLKAFVWEQNTLVPVSNVTID